MAEVLNNLANNLPRRKFDVVIVGAGGSGMRASLQLALAGLSAVSGTLQVDVRPAANTSIPTSSSVNVGGSGPSLSFRALLLCLLDTTET